MGNSHKDKVIESHARHTILFLANFSTSKMWKNKIKTDVSHFAVGGQLGEEKGENSNASVIHAFEFGENNNPRPPSYFGHQ